MTEALKCPACAASLDYPVDGGASMRCPYCNTTVLLTGGVRAGPGTGNAGQLTEVLNRLRAGDKIGAIRVYRQINNSSLTDAKTAVEQMERQQSMAGNAARDITKAASSAMAMGLLLTFGILFITGMIVFFTFRSVRRSMPPTPSWVPTPSIVRPSLMTPSGPPPLANMALQFGTEGIGAGGFDDIRSIATDNQGHLFVAEYSSGRVQAFDTSGKFLAAWSLGHGKYVQNIAADRHGMVYAVFGGAINRYDGLTGKDSGAVEDTLDDVKHHYTDAFTTFDGGLYAIDNESNLIEIDPSNGQIKRVINTQDKIGERVTLEHLAVIGTGEIFALGGNKGVIKFAPDGHYINRFAGGGDLIHRQPGRLYSPFNIAVDGKGRIYVSDSSSGVQVFDSEGGYIGSFGGNEVIFGITVTDANEIYACCRNAHMVKKFVLNKK